MNVDGEYRIPATPERVWEALHDPETLRACIPGCEQVEVVADDEFTGRLMTRVGAVSAVFEGRLKVTEETYPQTWQMDAHVESPTAGWADGHATVTLTADAAGTVLAYRARFEPGGRLASVGSRLLHGVAIRLANEFFACLIERLGPHPLSAEPQELAEPTVVSPRRIVVPLAPTAPTVQALTAAQHAAPPPLAEPEGAPSPNPRAQRIIIGVGWALFAFIFTSMMMALFSRG